MKITNATKTGGNGDREEAWVRGEGWEEREWRMEGREGKKQQVWQGGEERGQGGWEWEKEGSWNLTPRSFLEVDA